MKKRTLVNNLSSCVDKTVLIMGFVDTIRDQKRMQFLIIRDHTGKAQVVHMKSDDENTASIISSLTEESTVIITGKVIDAPNVKLGGLEIQIESIDISSIAESPLPISKSSSLEKQMDWRQISLRTEESFLIFKIQTALEKAMREYWLMNDFIEIHSPKLMGTASESGAELFELDYFKKTKAYLAQSPQFYKQLAMSAGFDKVFEIGPVFRAESSFTPRHATEFTSVDMEISWIDSYTDLMTIEEEWIVYVISSIVKEFGDEITKVFGTELVVPTLPFPRITLNEARCILEADGHVINHKEDLDPQGERLLSDYVAKKYGHEFVFVTDYPADVRAFYHMRSLENPELTDSFDLLWKGVEITTGAQREHRVDKLMQQATEQGFAHDPLAHYFNFFRHGCPPHGGMGIGLARFLMLMLNKANVREVTFIHRGPNRLHP